jgi:hypothetical protein
VTEFAQLISANPVQELVEEINCKYKFLLLAVAVMLTEIGPPLTVKVYQPSLPKVPLHVPIFGEFCVPSEMVTPPGHNPLIVTDVALEQEVPCDRVVWITKKKAKQKSKAFILLMLYFGFNIGY